MVVKMRIRLSAKSRCLIRVCDSRNAKQPSVGDVRFQRYIHLLATDLLINGLIHLHQAETGSALIGIEPSINARQNG